MPHATAPDDVEFLQAALEYSDAQLRRAQEEIWRLRAALVSYQRPVIYDRGSPQLIVAVPI